MAQLGQLGLHLAAERAPLAFGQGDIEADERLAELFVHLQQYVEGEAVAGRGIGYGVVDALAGQQVGGCGFYLVHGRDVEVGVVGVAAPRQAGAGPNDEITRSQVVERQMVGAPRHFQPAAERDGARGVDVGVERTVGAHFQVVAANRVDNHDKGRFVGHRHHGRDVVAGGRFHGVQRQLPLQHSVHGRALVNPFHNAFGGYLVGFVGWRLDGKLGAFYHRHVGIDFE